GGHRRRRGQPRDLAAGEAGVRRAPGGGPGQPPEERVVVQRELGVDVSVSTPHLILALTEEALSVGSLVRLLQLEKGRARLVEVTLAPDAPVIGPTIRELDLPRDSTFVAVVREEHVVVPRGDTVFQAGDEVIALVTPESEDEIRRILTGK